MDSSQQPLPIELSHAIRASHVQLNRLITARLPLCLPPYTTKPLLYASGMTVFSHIYSAIETAVDELLSNPNTDPRVCQMLRTLHTTGLPRLDRLAQDLSAIGQRHNQSTVPLQIQLQTLSDETAQYRTDLHSLLLARPHLLLAWSWNMYLAIFNGGRFIRRTLRDAGPTYWSSSGSGKEGESCSDSQPQLRFWEFDGDMDGDDIKDAFKLNLEAASELLTASEREEVVQEAGRVMSVCQEIVGRLDEMVGGRVSGEISREEVVKKTKRKNSPPESAMSTVLVVLMALLTGLWDALRRLLSIGKGNAAWEDKDGFVRGHGHLHAE
ncbi:hypothetical protein DV737_g2086, partial [Chaetothyriales sp. CBS 132003]